MSDNTDIASEIVKDVLNRFYPAFVQMEERFRGLFEQEEME